MQITVSDWTQDSDTEVRQAAQRWHDALIGRGIDVVYVDHGPMVCPVFERRDDFAIAVYDRCDPTAGQWAQSQYFSLNGSWSGGLVRIMSALPATESGVAIVVHELGHCVMLSHTPQGSDSCMTPIPILAYPSASDAANALPGYPPPPPPPPPKKRKRKHKHGRH